MSFSANDIWNSWTNYASGSGVIVTVTDGVLKVEDATTTAGASRYVKTTLKGGDALRVEVMARAISGQGKIYLNLNSLPGAEAAVKTITGEAEFRKYTLDYSVPHIYSAVDVYIGVGTTYSDLGVVEFFAPNLFINGTRLATVADSDYGMFWAGGSGVLVSAGLPALYVQNWSTLERRVAVARTTITGEKFSAFGSFSPGFRVLGNTTESSSVGIGSCVDTSSGSTLRFLKSRASGLDTHKATQAGDGLGAIDFFGDTGSEHARGARIDVLQFAGVSDGLVQAQMQFKLTTPSKTDEVAMVLVPGAIKPGVDGIYNFGSAVLRLNNSFFAVAPTVTSDERSKQDISMIDDCVLDAWATIEYQQYRLRQAVDLKGGDARTHIGLIAQSIESAFVLAGLDPFEFGILCYDEWPDQEEVIDVWADEFDDEGELVRAAGREITQPFVPAGNRYGVRYEEALALEAALMRRTTKRLAARLEALEST